MEKEKASHPSWALACKCRGTELRLLKGTYYLYEVSSRWDREKKRSVKITGKLLGKVTEQDGFVESDKARLRKQETQIERVQVKEYGVTLLINSVFKEIVSVLTKFFPDKWQDIICLSYGRLVYQSPLKNMAFHYANSYLSEQYPGIDLSAKRLGSFLRELGRNRSQIVEFCRSFRLEDDCILFDGTDLFSHSEQMELPKFGKSKFGTYDEMINLMCLFSTGQQMPVYYRLLPGNIRDTTAFSLSLAESGAREAIVIIDKGFASKKNIAKLEEATLRFIIPLPRNSKIIDYKHVEDKSLFDGHFKYHDSHIWYYTQKVDATKQVVLFREDELRNREEKDCLNRIDSNTADYSLEKFHLKRHTFGTIATIENTLLPAEDIFFKYKTRGQVETMIDAIKNILEADHTYMQNPQTLEGWMFINLVALKWYYTLLNLLKKHELNRKYAPSDFLQFLIEVKQVKINNQWHNAECIHKTNELLSCHSSKVG